jgi:hypothetical protein
MNNIEPVYTAIILTIISLVRELLIDKTKKINLVMDRTNWKIGRLHVNLLVLGVLLDVPLYKAVFIPILWQNLGTERSRGNSSTADRETLISRAMTLLGNNEANLDQFTLLADREFVGHDFWDTMKDWGLHFIIRTRAWMYLDMYAKKLIMSKLDLKKKIEVEIRLYGRATISFHLGEHEYHLLIIPNLKQGGSKKAKTGTLSEKAKMDEKYLFIVSDTPCWDTMAETYSLRWKIECFFKNLKSNGLNLEDLNLRPEEKIHLMFAILSLLYMIALQEGIVHLEKNPNAVKMKTFKVKVPANEHLEAHILIKIYPELSLYRLGYDLLLQGNGSDIIRKLLNIKKLKPKKKPLSFCG